MVCLAPASHQFKVEAHTYLWNAGLEPQHLLGITVGALYVGGKGAGAGEHAAMHLHHTCFTALSITSA